MKQLKDSKDNLIFSLDIGTRTIIGIVGQYTRNEKFIILDYCIKEHDKRNMYDGQIHDIDGVTKIVVSIKEELEERLGTRLKRVSIAAAGRSLKTCKAKVDKEIDSSSEINKNMIEILELEAIQKAQQMITTSEKQSGLKYYNIGHSVINYYLDDNLMNKLEGHRGDKIGVNLLATFLPHMVIESLYSVIAKAGLEVDNIALEPIAAINVAIKEELRLLNLVLIDIGAGTSDIAITKEGKIVAYAMISKAGDEITEAISKEYLLDFNSGERLKIGLSSQNEHKFMDVVGVEHRLSTKEIVKSIYETIIEISGDIAEKIIEYNGKPPSAVFIVGGSSQMPGLKECIAEKLGLPKERVSIRDTSFIENIEGINKDINGPDIVTPIGIAIEGVTKRNNDFLQVEFNGKEIRIFNTRDIKISDILVLTGFNPRDLISKSGESFIYYLNGGKREIVGKEGKHAEIYVNSQKGDLNTPVKDNDKITIIKATKGGKRIPHLNDCVPIRRIISFNNNKVNLIKEIRLNGVKVEDNPILVERDNIEVLEIRTVADLLEYMREDVPVSDIFVNGNEVIEESLLLKENDKVTVNYKRNIRLMINGKEKIIEYNKEDFVFVDIFDHINFDLTKAKGNLKLKLNGKDVEYLAPLKNDDVIELYWTE